MPPDPVKPGRDTIDNWPVAGLGGFMAFKWNDYTDHTEPERLAIREWQIEHIYHNLELAMSGGLGSLQRDRVCDDFRFTVAMHLDRMILHEAEHPVGPGPVGSPFMDARLEGSDPAFYTITVRFYCGDPAFQTHPDEHGILRPETWLEPAGENAGLYYRCPEVALQNVFIVNSGRGDRNVHLIIKGVGSAPLGRWVDGVWCGAGAFGISQTDQREKLKLRKK